MAITNTNDTRIITNSPSTIINNHTWTLNVAQTALTGVSTAELIASDATNDFDLALVMADGLKADFIANHSCKVNDVVFDQWIDGGPGLPIACNVDLGTEFESDADIAAFLATGTLEIIVKTNS